MGQMRLDGHIEVESFRFVPGDIFARFLLGAGRQWALLSAKALGYDPYRQTWETRLARYLSWQWRIRAKDEAYSQPYRVETLLDHAGEELNARTPSRTKECLEKALDRLQADKVIADWQYDRFDDWFGELPRKGWAEAWLRATVVIEPPDVVVDEYEKIQRPGQRAIRATRAEGSQAAGQKDLGVLLKERRKQLGLFQLRAAEDLGISQSQLSRLEGSKSMSPDPLKERLLIWLSA